MIRPEDARIEKMMEAFEGFGLTEEELELVEKYVREEADEETLSQLTFRDLEKITPEAKTKCREVCNSFLNKKRYEDLAKMFKVLFAIGQSTCGGVFTSSISILKNEEFCKELGMEREKLVAVYAQFLGTTRWFCRTYTMEGIYELAEKNPENLRKALEYSQGGTAEGRLLIYTVYFWKKYRADFMVKNPENQTGQDAAQEDGKKSGFLGNISKFFGGNGAASEAAAAEESPLEEQDIEIMNRYEGILVHNIGVLFNKALAPELVTKLQEASRQGEIPEELLNQVRKVAINENLLDLLGSCAYLNYMLSKVLKSILTLCAAANTKRTLDMFANMNGRMDLAENGGDYDRIFGMEPQELISWAAEKGSEGAAKKMLAVQFKKNRQQFLDYQKEATLDGSNRMMEVIQEEDPGLHKKLMSSGVDTQKEKVIQVLITRMGAKNEASSYLRGEKEIQDLYKVEGTLIASNKYGGGNEWKAFNSFHKRYKDKEFFNRVMVIMSMSELPYFFRQPMYDRNVNMENQVLEIFEGLKDGGLDMAHRVHTYVMVNDTFYNDSDKEKLLNILKPVFLQYLKEAAEETKQAFAGAEAYGRYFALCVMEQELDNYKAEILGFSQDTAKVVKEKLEAILKEQNGWRPEVTALLASKKAAERELAIRVMLHWNTPEDLETLGKLLETEKNTKVRNLLESVLQPANGEEGAPVGAKVLTQEELIKNLHKGGKKRSLAWAYETPFSEVHKKSGELADEEHLQAILLCYAALTTPGVSNDAKLLAESLNEAELAMYVNELFDKWLEAGAEAKKRWVMYAASIHGGSDIVRKLHHQIQEWPQIARGAIAADAVQALALNPQPQALLLVDGITRKFKFKQVKAAAGKALEFAAAQLGLTREELEDKIVPNLGFDENMERHFDYGERSFTVTITPALEMEIFGEDGKKLKNLPAPGKKDDEEKATAAYEAFKEMKKQMKTTISSQKARLEAALSSERLWSITAWQDLFVKNPVMHQFAIGLIWGIYEEQKLTQSFRYMEDGSFNTEEEEEFTLPEQGYIGLVHPIELTAESKEAWKQQLEDYEITQPIEQLNREIYYRTEEEEKGKSIERFGGMYVNDLSLNGKMQQLGWYRGDVLDAGCYDTFYRTDTGLGLCTELHFSGTYVGGQGEDVTIYEARFYKIGEGNGWGYHVADEAKDTKALLLKDIPQRYFSEIILQLTKATASSKEKDENWKKKR